MLTHLITLQDMAKADSKHFLILFRDRKCQYRGMYIWDEESNQVHKICGIGPKVITEDMMLGMFKLVDLVEFRVVLHFFKFGKISGRIKKI